MFQCVTVAISQIVEEVHGLSKYILNQSNKLLLSTDGTDHNKSIICQKKRMEFNFLILILFTEYSNEMATKSLF